MQCKCARSATLVAMLLVIHILGLLRSGWVTTTRSEVAKDPEVLGLSLIAHGSSAEQASEEFRKAGLGRPGDLLLDILRLNRGERVSETSRVKGSLEDLSTSQSLEAGDCWKSGNSSWSCLPSSILIGVQKGSTGEVLRWLRFNRQLCVYPGEMHFFDYHGIGKYLRLDQGRRDAIMAELYDALHNDSHQHEECCYYKANAADYSSLKKTWREEYARKACSLTSSDILRGRQVWEKTPSYFDLVDPLLVSSFFPNVRLAVFLTDPADRLYSGYWNGCVTTCATCCSVDMFRQKLEHVADMKQMKSLRRETQGWSFKRQVLLGFYHRHLRKWADAFAAAPGNKLPMLIMFSENFKTDPFHVLSEYEEFLSVEKTDYTARATRLPNNFYAVANDSKAYRHHAPGYEPLTKPLHDRIVELFYADPNRALHKLLFEEPPRTRFRVVAPLPEWLQESKQPRLR